MRADLKCFGAVGAKSFTGSFVTDEIGRHTADIVITLGVDEFYTINFVCGNQIKAAVGVRDESVAFRRPVESFDEITFIG